MGIFEDLVKQINTTNRQICRQLDEDIAWIEERKNIYAQVAENLEVIIQKADAQRKGD